MQQVLHLLIVDRARRAALAARYGARWLLPITSCGETERAAPLVARWCAERGLASDVAGQWLGRVGPDASDWLMAIPARAGSLPVEPSLEWMDIDALSSSASILDYQTWALARSLQHGTLPSVAGPFGSLEWPEQVRVWIGESIGSPPCAWTPYRVSSHQVVLGAETACGRGYFKGLSGARAAEAAVTPALASIAPASFAPTVAIQHYDDASVWWLTEECAGRPSRDAPLVAATLGRVQQALITAAEELPALARADLHSAAQWACARPCDADRLIRAAFTKVSGADVPETWIPMDLDPTNVLVHDRGVRFIDLDDSFLGPAPLAMATFARRCRTKAAYRTYEQAWSPALTGLDWESFEIAAAVFEAWLGWRRVTQHVERGEVHAALDRVEMQIRARLNAALYRR